MNEVYEKLLKCYESFEKKITFKPEIALILGSGLGDFAETMDIKETLDYSELEGFPISTVSGHKGRFVFGYVEGVPVVAMQGRVHYYEGYPVQDVVLPTRLMKLMGAKVLFLTNAAGGINKSYNCGDFMLIKDHISSLVPSPLIGANLDELGVFDHCYILPIITVVFDVLSSPAFDDASITRRFTFVNYFLTFIIKKYMLILQIQ